MTPSSSLSLDYLPGSYDERNDEARYLFNQGEQNQAAAICQRIIERISRLPERRRSHGSPLHDALMAAAILLAEIHAKQGDWPALDDLCTRGQANHPVYAHRWAIEPFVLRIKYGQNQEGITGIQALAEANPGSFFFWRMLAQMALDVDDLDLALAASDRSMSLAQLDEDPGDMASYYIVRFKLFRQRGEWHAAAQEWIMACAWDEGMEDMREAVVRMFLDTGVYDDALDYLDDESLTATLADYYRAWIANQRGDQVRARHLWRKIIEADAIDDDLDIPVVRALAYCWLRQPDAALALMLEELASGGLLSMAEALALALAWAMHGDAAAAHANVKLAAQRQTSSAQPSKLIPALDWIDFEQLVEDEAIKAELQPYFQMPRRAAL